GKTELPVQLIQSIQVSAMTGPGQLPSGLVALWSGEGNGDDSVGGNNATPIGNVTFAEGQVGQAFCLDGHSSYLTVPASPSLNVGAGDGLTITAWIKPNAFDVDVSGAPIIEWDSETTDGCELWSGGSLFVNIRDLSGNGHTVNFSYAFDTNNFQFVAMTYDKNSGNIFLYINGVAVTSKNYGSFTPQTTYPVNIGRRTGQPVGNGDTYGGLIDELAIYNRALSASEIEAVYAEQK
ncbi:MAG TPA: LamG domain-containing protein, partial [Candidatus Aquilonibacter sp.]|nr:LamG domain-containing protein [Candidatus Aquilonibacter sp.]